MLSVYSQAPTYSTAQSSQCYVQVSEVSVPPMLLDAEVVFLSLS